MHAINRRRFLQSATAASAAALGGFPINATGDTGNRPNVLFIAVDDLNDWTGFLGGHPDAKTPHLDRLAARGTAFTHTYCPAPLCNASRASLMTGIIPSRSGVYGNRDDWRENPVLSGVRTLSQHFMDNGYTAKGTGKIYHGRYPHPASWDTYWPSKTRTRPDDPEPPRKPWGGGKAASRHFDWGPLAVPDSAMADDQVVGWTAQQLQHEHDKPFFLACGIFRPHLPWYVPQQYFDLYPLDEITLPVVKEDDLDDIPPAGRRNARTSDHKRVTENDGQWRKAVQGYLASVSFADACVGKLMAALDKSPHKDNTLVVLWSDHGWHLGEKLHWRKFALWEEATRNGMIFAGPGITPGQRCETPVGLIDIYPTLIERCGLSSRADLDGVSLGPLLDAPHATWERPALTTHGQGNHSVRSKRWRYTRYADGSEELYDHDADPMEWNNLANMAEHEGVKSSLANWMPKS